MNVQRISGVGLNLLTKTSYMYVNGSLVSGVIIAPNGLEKIFSLIYFAGIFHKDLKHFEFFGRKGNLLAFAESTTCGKIEGDISQC